MKHLLYFLGIALLTFSCTEKDDPFSENNPAVDERNRLARLVNDVSIEISNSDPTINFSDLSPLDDLAGAKIIGMGEATHGTKEFFEMKHKILRYFVEEHGYRGIIMEADFGECLRANEYVVNNIGTIEELIEDMWFWTWATEEVKDMIEWMHDYNIDKPDHEKIYYLGSDNQTQAYNIKLIEERISQFPDEIKNSLGEYLSNLEMNIYDVDDDLILEGLLNVDTLIQELQVYKTEIEALSSDKEYEILERLAIVTKQAFNARYQREQDDLYNYRDLYMAENSEWWANHFGQDEKFLAWAHNAHVCAGVIHEMYGGSQGAHLRSNLGEDYKVIGFSTALGAINAWSYDVSLVVERPLPTLLQFTSLNDIFHENNSDNFIWMLNSNVRDNPVFEWFDEERDFMLVGAVHPDARPNYYRKANIVREFDAMIHFDVSTPTDLIQ